MEWIRAEQLQELQVNVIYAEPVRSSFQFYEAKITPRVLRVNVKDVRTLDEAEIPYNFSEVYSVGFDEENAHIWSRVEELHVTFFNGTRHLSRVLTRALLGDRHLEPCYPRLRCLTVRYSNAGQPDFSPTEMQEKVDELLDIKRRREEAGLTKITRLKVGWHWAEFIHAAIGDRSPESWMTEWRNCLEGEML